MITRAYKRLIRVYKFRQIVIRFTIIHYQRDFQVYKREIKLTSIRDNGISSINRLKAVGYCLSSIANNKEKILQKRAWEWAFTITWKRHSKTSEDLRMIIKGFLSFLCSFRKLAKLSQFLDQNITKIFSLRLEYWFLISISGFSFRLSIHSAQRVFRRRGV